MTVWLVMLGGFIGALFRFYISRLVNSRFGSKFPAGTFFVNLTGSFLLGFLIGFQTPPSVYASFGIGFLGSFTTYSTFMNESVFMKEGQRTREAGLYVIFSLFFGFLFASTGLIIGGFLTR